MSRYIDANKLKEQVQKAVYDYWNSGSGGYYLAEDAIEDIDHAPTADVVEVRHGEWIGGRYNDWKNNVYEERCSLCGRYSTAYASNYCPNCGARMDGERREK